MSIQQMEAIERIHVSPIPLFRYINFKTQSVAKIAQLGERMTEDHKVRCSIHLLGEFFFSTLSFRMISFLYFTIISFFPALYCIEFEGKGFLFSENKNISNKGIEL